MSLRSFNKNPKLRDSAYRAWNVHTAWSYNDRPFTDRIMAELCTAWSLNIDAPVHRLILTFFLRPEYVYISSFFPAPPSKRHKMPDCIRRPALAQDVPHPFSKLLSIFSNPSDVESGHVRAASPARATTNASGLSILPRCAQCSCFLRPFSSQY